MTYETAHAVRIQRLGLDQDGAVQKLGEDQGIGDPGRQLAAAFDRRTPLAARGLKHMLGGAGKFVVAGRCGCRKTRRNLEGAVVRNAEQQRRASDAVVGAAE